MPRIHFLRLGALAAALIVCAAACGGGDDAVTLVQPPDRNLFVNPGLEDGSEPWITLDPASGFVRSEERAHSGAASALLSMHDGEDARGFKVYFLVQELSPEAFPDVVSGYYRVENWERGAPKQYLQFVVGAVGADNLPDTAQNFQIRYLLAGIDHDPLRIGNARYVFVSKQQPREGAWIPFEVNVREDFEREWGAAPEDFEKLRVLFEVRWEDKSAGDGTPSADVYYDDLYIGPRGQP